MISIHFALVVALHSSPAVTLKIERTLRQRKTLIRLCGEFRAEHIDQVKTELRPSGLKLALDLEEVDLVDVDSVRFLNACESAGISVVRCSSYIREWMLRERGRPEATPGM
jgi:hypothetical protein